MLNLEYYQGISLIVGNIMIFELGHKETLFLCLFIFDNLNLKCLFEKGFHGSLKLFEIIKAFNEFYMPDLHYVLETENINFQANITRW